MPARAALAGTGASAKPHAQYSSTCIYDTYVRTAEPYPAYDTYGHTPGELFSLGHTGTYIFGFISKFQVPGSEVLVYIIIYGLSFD